MENVKSLVHSLFPALHLEDFQKKRELHSLEKTHHLVGQPQPLQQIKAGIKAHSEAKTSHRGGGGWGGERHAVVWLPPLGVLLGCDGTSVKPQHICKLHGLFCRLCHHSTGSQVSAVKGPRFLHFLHKKSKHWRSRQCSTSQKILPRLQNPSNSWAPLSVYKCKERNSRKRVHLTFSNIIEFFQYVLILQLRNWSVLSPTVPLHLSVSIPFVNFKKKKKLGDKKRCCQLSISRTGTMAFFFFFKHLPRIGKILIQQHADNHLLNISQQHYLLAVKYLRFLVFSVPRFHHL